MKVNLHLQKEALRLRKEWGIGPDDPVRLPSLVLKLNLLIIFKPLSSKFSGMTMKNRDMHFLLINSNHPVGRQNFTICHELYHIYIEKNVAFHPCLVDAFNKNNKSEFAADAFASLFLLPEAGLIDLIPEKELKKNAVTLPTILKLEQFYRCSRTALLYRLENLDLLDRNHSEIFKSSISANAGRYGFDKALYKPGRHNQVLGSYGTLARKLFDMERISETHYMSLLNDIGIDTDTDNNDEINLLF